MDVLRLHIHGALVNLDHRVSPLRVGPVMTVLESVESEAGV